MANQGTYTATNLPADGTTIEAADVNTDLTGLINEFNKNIDNNKIAASAGIELSKLEATTAGKMIFSGAGTVPAYYTADGWIPFPASAAYVDADTISLSGDWTAIFTKGDKIKFTQSSTIKYFYVIATPVFSAGVTSIDVLGDSDVPVANSAITLAYYSKDASPLNFQHWFKYTPTFSASGSMTVSGASIDFKFRCDGATVTVSGDFLPTVGGTPSYAIYATTPFAVTSRGWIGSGRGENSGGFQTRYDTGSSKIEWRKYDGGNLTAGSTFFSCQISMGF